MSQVLEVRDKIRDFLRKYDEITSPLLRFLLAYILFTSINSMFGYSEFLSKGIVIFLLSVICALVTNSVIVFIGGICIVLHCFSVSVEVGIVSVLFFVAMYCLYLRMFSHCSSVLMIVPVLFLLKIQFAAPIIVGIFAGMAGIVPMAFGVVMFYFAKSVEDVSKILKTATEDELKKFQAYEYIVDAIVKNKELLLIIVSFAVVVVITYVIYKLPFNCSWYVAIGVGGLSTILVFMVCGIMLEIPVNIGSVVVGALVGTIIATVIQMCKSMVDYSKKESVQFEDDDYYYYVTAIPKYNMSTKKKSVKKMTEEE